MLKQKKINPAITIQGSKKPLADWIISHFPEGYEDMVYLEPFCGDASILLAKRPSVEECINDIDPELVCIHRVVRDDITSLLNRLKKVKSNPEYFEQLKTNISEDHINVAARNFALVRLSRGGSKQYFGRVNQSAWEKTLKHLPVISDRLADVFITCKHGLKLLDAFNTETTLVYLDPPYLPSTRTSQEAYQYDLDTDGHIELAKTLKNFRGKVILSGHSSPLYNRYFKEWRCKRKSGSKTSKSKTECLWLNF